MEEYIQFSDKFENDVYHRLNLKTCMERRNSAGGTSPASVRAQIEYIRKLAAE